LGREVIIKYKNVLPTLIYVFSSDNIPGADEKITNAPTCFTSEPIIGQALERLRITAPVEASSLPLHLRHEFPLLASGLNDVLEMDTRPFASYTEEPASSVKRKDGNGADIMMENNKYLIS
jgi:hypothetical protein